MATKNLAQYYYCTSTSSFISESIDLSISLSCQGPGDNGADSGGNVDGSESELEYVNDFSGHVGYLGGDWDGGGVADGGDGGK